MREVLHSANIFFPDDSIYFPQVTDPFKAIFFSSVSIFIARNGKNSRLPLKRNFFRPTALNFLRVLMRLLLLRWRPDSVGGWKQESSWQRTLLLFSITIAHPIRWPVSRWPIPEQLNIFSETCRFHNLLDVILWREEKTSQLLRGEQ